MRKYLKSKMREGHPNSRKYEICVCDYRSSYLRTCFSVCVYNQRFSERLNNIYVVITVDVKVYTEAMLIDTIYLYLIFRLRFLSPLSLILTSHVNS